MSVKSLNAPCSVYSSQSNADQDYAHSFNPLNEFRVVPLIQPVPDGGDKSEIPDSFLHDFVPWSPDKESVCDALFPILGSNLCNQSLLFWNEPDIREPTPKNRLNPDDRLINLPEEFSNPQGPQPVAVDPLNRRQATSDNPANSVKILDHKASRLERNRNSIRERRKNPGYAKREKECNRKRNWERYHNDPLYAKHQKEKSMKRNRKDLTYQIETGGTKLSANRKK